MKKLNASIKDRMKNCSWADGAACLLVAVFAVIFIFLSFGRHDTLKSYLNDLGTYDQIVWNTLHGRFFENSANMLGERNYLGAHFAPILLVFLPFYAVFSSPKWLLFFQAIAVGLSGFFIYSYAKENLKRASLGIVFLASYLLNPYLHNGLLYDFHEVVLAVFFSAGAFYFLEKGRDKFFILFSVLLALSQEHLSLLVFMMGVYLIVSSKRYKFGVIISAASLAYFLVTILVFMPHFSATGNPSLIANASGYPLRYSWLGNGFGEIVRNIFSHPLKIAGVMLDGGRLTYLFGLIAPVFSLALFSWPVIIALPALAINLLSSLPLTYSVFFYHSAVIVPFLFFSAIATFKRWFLGNRSMEIFFSAVIFLFSVWIFHTMSILPVATSNSAINDFLPGDNARRIRKIKSLIPADARISVQHNLGPHFSERREIYRFPLQAESSDFVVLDRFNPYLTDQSKFNDFSYSLQMDLDQWDKKIKELKSSPDFEVFFDDGEYLVFRNKSKR